MKGNKLYGSNYEWLQDLARAKSGQGKGRTPLQRTNPSQIQNIEALGFPGLRGNAE